MENDYISREEAKRELLTEATIINDRRFMKTDSAIAVLDLIPAADVIEVIRCKECKWYSYRHHEKLCIRHSGLAMVNDDSYCCYAERKENET